MADQISETREASNALYRSLKENGYEGLPSEDIFYNTLQDSTQAANIYQSLEDNGYQGLPDRESFYKTLIEGYGQQPETTENPEQPVNGFVQPEFDASKIVMPQPDNRSGLEKVIQDQYAPEIEAQKQKNLSTPGTDEWRARTVDIPGENPYNGQTYGTVYDSIISDYGKNLNHPDIDPYAEARAQIQQAGITDDLNPDEADSLALQIRDGYANLYAGNGARQMVSSLPDRFDDIDGLMDGLWYNRELQGKIAHEAGRLGLRKENYVNYFVKPQLAKALRDRYGYDVESAKHIANRLFSNEAHTMERVRQNEAASMIGKYAAPQIQQYFDAAMRNADSKFRGEAEGSAMTPYGNAGQLMGASIRHWQESDPAKIWEQLKPGIEQMGMSLVNDPEFFAEAMDHADEEGVETTQWIEKRILPMLESQIKSQFEQMAIEREMPKNTMEYIWANIQQSLVGTLARVALESQARRRMKTEALQRTETGQNADYTPSFGARIAGGAAAMLPDMALPYGGPFGLTAKMATKPVQGMSQRLIADGMRPLAARMIQSSAGGSLSLGAFEGLKGGVEGGFTPIDQESYLEYNRSAEDVLKDVVKGIWEKGVPSAVTGSTMIGGPVGQKISNGRGVLANALGWGAQVGIDAAGATALSTIPKIASGGVNWDEVGTEFASNVGTFAALGLHSKAREFASLANGGRAWNGVPFSKEDIQILEDRYLSPLRKQIEELESTQKNRGLISERAIGIDADEIKREAVGSAGAIMYEDMMHSYAIPRELKVKVAQALGVEIPVYALKPEVVELERQATEKAIELGWTDAMDYDYNKPGGVADKVRSGQPLNDSELTLRLIYQDNGAFNEAVRKQQSGEPLSEQERELVSTYQSRLNQMLTEYSREESGRLAHLFEEEHGLKPGALMQMMRDAAEGKAVSSNLLNEYETMLRDYNLQLDAAKSARQLEQQAAQTGETPAVEVTPAVGTSAEEAPKVNMVAGNAAGVEPVADQDGNGVMEESPAGKRNFELNDEISLVDDDGTVHKGDIVSVPSVSDGTFAIQTDDGRVIYRNANYLQSHVTEHNGETVANKVPQPVEKAVTAPAAEAVPSDITVEKPASENAASGETVSETAPETALSRIPRNEKGELDYEKAEANDSYDALVEELGEEDAATIAQSEVDDATKRLQRIQKQGVKGATIEEKKRSLADRAAAIREQQAKIDYWNSVLDVPKTRKAEADRIAAEEAQRKAEEERLAKMQTPEGRTELLAEGKNPQERTAIAKEIYGDYFNENVGEPDTVEELVSMLLPYGKLNWEGYDRGTTHVRGLQEELGSQFGRGLSKDRGSSGFNAYLAKKGEGESIETIAHQIYESDANLIGDDHRFTTEEIRNAAIDLLLSAEKPTDIRDFTLNSRIEMAEKMLKGEMDHAEENYINGRKNETGQEVDLDNTGGEAGRDRQDGQVEIQAQGAEGAAGADTQQPKAEGTEAGTGVPPVSAADVSGGTSGVANTGGLPFEGPSDGDAPFLKVSADDNSFAGRLTRAKQQTNTEPTDAQKEKGNYRKGHVSFGGYDFVVENPEGSFRRGKDKTGRSWEQQMHNTYGYILGKKGKDGDHLDVFINDAQDLDSWNGKVYVIDQVDPGTGKFDEHKIMYGFGSEAEARDAYLSNYEDGWKGLGRITGVDKDTFDKWLDSSDRKIKEFAEHSITRDALARQEPGEKKPVADAEIDKALMNEVMKEPASKGVEFITDTDEGQRVLDEANGSTQVKKMGTSTRKRQSEILESLKDRSLSDQQKQVADTFSGLSDKTSITFKSKDGKSRNIVFRQGNENRAGVKHSVFRHYNTDSNAYTADEITMIPEIIANGDRKQNQGKRVSYKYEKDGIIYTVTTEVKGKDELFTNFYTNRKPSAAEQGTSNTENRHVQPQQTVSGAKVQQNSETAKDSERKFFKTPDGHAYGFTYKGKIYIDPRIATSETPVHEYGHLWAEMKRQTSPEEWNRIKDVLLNDRLIEPFIEKVRRDYPELEGREDDFVEEVLTQFSGRHGAEKLRRMAQEIKEELGGDATAETIAETAVRRVKSLLNEFWKGVCDLMGWQYTSAEDIADAVLRDMLNGVNPRERMKEAANDKLRSQAEIERTLMGVHNLSEEKLRKVLKQGGLANPSLAVIDTNQHMHTDYGSISLIPKATLIDARTGRNAGTFTADAWTPTYPTVQKRMSDKGQDRFWKDLRTLREEDGEMANFVRMAFDTWLDKEVGQERLAYWYLKEKGMKPEMVRNKNPYGEDIVKRIDELTDNGNLEVSRLSEEQIKEVADMYHAYKEGIGEPVIPAEERIKRLQERMNPDKPSPFLKLQQFRLDELAKYGELLHNLNEFEYAVRRSADSDGKPNVEATVNNAQKVVKDKKLQQDFDKWLQDKADSYGIEEWLYNGTDDRTGKQKWVRNTLQNASKLMKKEGLNGAVNWSSIGNWIAKVANKEKTLAGIRKNKKNLQTSEEEHEAFREKWSQVMYDIATKLGKGDSWSGENIMSDILDHKDYASYLKREYGMELSKEDREAIDTFINEVQTSYPTGYFETKFERPVMLDEFEIAVVPENTSPDIVEALKNAGLDVRTYDDTGTEEQKDTNRTQATMDAVSGRDDIMFQMVGREGAAEADRAEGNDERSRNLALAEESEKAGVDARAVKLATGWERGADGQWRYEIPDADVDILSKYKAKVDEMKKDGVAKPQPIIKLGELLGEDNGLFRYYPDLKKTDVLFSDTLPDGTAGSFDGTNIELNVKETSRFDGDDLNNENVYGTLLHEVQHAIQEKEGFAQGGSIQTSTTEDGINAIIEKKERQRADIKTRLDANNKILGDPEELKMSAELEGKTEKEVKDQLTETVDQQAAEYDTLGLQIDRLRHTKAPSMTDAKDLYHRLAGEVESRNVTERMGMTEEQRRQSLASETEDVPREDQVIIMGDGTAMNINDIKPVGENRFGGIYDQFKGKVKEAFDFLTKKKEGYLKGVFHRDDLGDIDLAWGSAPTDYTGKGLAHIIRKHINVLKDFNDIDEAMQIITDVVTNGASKPNSDPKLVNIEKGDYRVVVAKNEEGNWILSAFDFVKPKKEKGKTLPPSKTPGQSNVEAGAVTSNPPLSDGKDTKNNDTLQGNQEKSAIESQENENNSLKFSKVGSPELEKNTLDGIMEEIERRKNMPKFQKTDDGRDPMARILDEVEERKETARLQKAELAEEDDIARKIYEEAVAKGTLKFQEAWQDSMISLKKLQEAIEAETGNKANGAEDAYAFENRMHGRAKNQSERFEWQQYQPMLKAFDDLTKERGWNNGQTMDYLISKHGLERNGYYGFRDALREKIRDEIREEKARLDEEYGRKKVDDAYYAGKMAELEEREKNVNAEAEEAMAGFRNSLAYKRAKEDYQNGTIGYSEYLRRLDDLKRSAAMRKKPKKNKDGKVVSTNYYDDHIRDYSGLTETFAKEMYDEAQVIKRRAQWMHNAKVKDPEKEDKLWQEYNEKMRRAYITAREQAEDAVFSGEKQNTPTPLKDTAAGRLWDKINSATKETLRIGYESGLMDRNTYNKVRDMFDYYIPLRGWDENKASDVYNYIGKENVFSPAVKKTWGRTSKAENPLAYVGNIAASTIISGNRNLMKQHFLNYVMNNPTSLTSISESWYENVGTKENPVWQLRTADTAGKSADEIASIVSDFNEEMAEKEKEGMAMPVRGRLRLDARATNAQKAEHVVEVQRNGHTYQIYINGDPKAAQALNGTNIVKNESRWREVTRNVNRYMAEFFTSKNPAFVLSNLSRDLNMAGASVAVNEGAEYNARFIKNVAKVLAAPRMGESSSWVKNKTGAESQPTGMMPDLMRKYKNGTLDEDNDTERYFKEFMNEGGETGFVNMLSVDSFKEKMQDEISQMQGSNFFGRGGKETTIGKGLRMMGETFEFYNRCAEDATRFIVYMTSREMGKTMEESIADAKDVTLNFNRKGTGGKGHKFMPLSQRDIQDMFIFVNPAIQALANMYRMGKNHPLKLGAVATSFMAGGFMMPILNNWFLNLFGDDDDKEAYWNLPPWVRKNNLVMWVPFTKNFITIPLAQEFRVFYGVGEMISSAYMEHPTKDMGLEIASSVADLVPINPTGNGGDLLVDFMPTYAQPIVQVLRNVDFTGKPIWRENVGNKLDPMYTKAYVGTPKWMVKASEKINDWTGGNLGKKGVVEEKMPFLGEYINNPAVWNHLLQGYLGGMYNTIAKAFDATVTGGKYLLGKGEAPNIYQVPVLNRFVNRPSERENAGQLGEEYWDMVKERDVLMNELGKNAQAAANGDAEAQKRVDEIMASDEFKRAQIIGHYKKILDNLRKGEKAAGQTEPESGARDMIRESIGLYKQQMEDELNALSGGTDPLEQAYQAFGNATTFTEKNRLLQKIKDLSSRPKNKKPAEEDVEAALKYTRDEEDESRKGSERYIMEATPDDIMSDLEITELKRQAREVHDDDTWNELDNQQKTLSRWKGKLGEESRDYGVYSMSLIRNTRQDAINTAKRALERSRKAYEEKKAKELGQKTDAQKQQ